MQSLVYLISVILVLSTLIACVPQTTNTDHSTAEAVDSTPDQTPDPTPNTQSRPATKTVTDDWTQQQIPVKLYDQEGIPFTTYFSEPDFIVEQASSGEGTGVWFYSKLDGKKYEPAYVHIFFPSNPLTVEEMKEAVSGERGLMKTNQWTVIRHNEEVAYSWAKERIDFEKRAQPQNRIGTVYIGEYNGKAFRITEHFPADYGDGFSPRASIILKELQLRGE